MAAWDWQGTAAFVGPGYAISPDAGDTATIVKLLRVAMLLPAILVAGQITRKRSEPGTKRPPLLPRFVVAFAALIALNSLIPIPKAMSEAGNALSRWCLVTSIAAIGMKTQLGEIVRLGWRPVALMFAETTLLAAMVLALLRLGAV